MKYWQLNNTWLQRHLAYPARVVVWTIADVANFIVFPFIWLAVYGDRQIIAGFTRSDIVTYYIIIAFISLGFSSHISAYLRQDIMEGGLNTVLVRPLKYFWYRFLHELSYRIVAVTIAIFLLAVVFIFLPQYIILPKNIVGVCLFILSLFFSFLISHLLQCVIGYSSFWLGETGAADGIRHLLEKVFSGELAPLVFFPVYLQITASYLPFKYTIYFPARIYLGQANGKELVIGFMVSIAWVVGLLLISSLMWKRGLKKYDGAGI